MIFGPHASTPASPRPAAVAGLFYPGDASGLRAWVDRALDDAPALPADAQHPKAIIVPHAGYVYSGVTAAAAYAGLRSARHAITRVVMLGPCHRVAVRGLALPKATTFETPLGTVPIDAQAVKAIATMPGVVFSDSAHAQEHALEVQLPFLQRVLAKFSLVPLVVGAASAQQVADVIEALWGGPETLIVISSDLSHYHRYEEAQAIDAATVRAILALSPTLDHEQACGATPIAGLIEVARRRGLLPELIDLRNSGDTAGDRHRVVGYASFAFRERESPAELGDEQGRTLLRLARGAIGSEFGGKALDVAGGWLDDRGATFVTLRQDEALRGCIGSLEARRRLREDVTANARAAAFGDPRFAPLTREEFTFTDIEVSLLSAAVPLTFADEIELFATVEPDVDGIVLEAAGRRATFLPQVWEQLPAPADFFDHLKRKAGLPGHYPLARCSIQRYTVRKWTERQMGLLP